MSAHIDLHSRPASLPGKWAAIVAYAAIFFGALPALLCAMGTRLDLLLSLAPVGPAGCAIGFLLALIGTFAMALAMVSLSRRGQGLPISHLAPARLVGAGLYARVRHPIYLAYAAAFAGLGLASGSLGRSAGATGLLLLGSLGYALGFEEPRLARRFGATYLAYVDKVPILPLPLVASAALDAVWRFARPRMEALANRVVLFRIGSTVWVTFGAFAALGSMLGTSICHLLVRGALSLPCEAAYAGGIVLATLAGARAVALLYQPRLLLREPGEAIRRVGFVSWGGYFGFFVYTLVFAGLARVAPLWLLDRAFIAALACSSVGRVGCFTYGCCYGRPCRATERGIRWSNPDAKVMREVGSRESAARAPTQLLSALLAAALVPLALATMARAASGVATVIGLLVYALGRFVVESLRDEPRFGASQLTRGQFASVLGALFCLAILLWAPFAIAPPGAAILAQPAHPSGTMWLVVAACGLMTFVVCGMHRHRVGHW